MTRLHRRAHEQAKGDGHAATRETRTEAGVAVRRRGEGPLPAVGGPAAASTESRVEAPQKAQNGHCVTQHSHFWAFTKNNTKQDLADTYTPVRGVTTAKRPSQVSVGGRRVGREWRVLHTPGPRWQTPPAWLVPSILQGRRSPFLPLSSDLRAALNAGPKPCQGCASSPPPPATLPRPGPACQQHSPALAEGPAAHAAPSSFFHQPTPLHGDACTHPRENLCPEHVRSFHKSEITHRQPRREMGHRPVPAQQRAPGSQ